VKQVRAKSKRACALLENLLLRAKIAHKTASAKNNTPVIPAARQIAVSSMRVGLSTRLLSVSEVLSRIRGRFFSKSTSKCCRNFGERASSTRIFSSHGHLLARRGFG